MHWNEYFAFMVISGYPPSAGTACPSEHHLAVWAAKQRLKYRNERLTSLQVSMLKHLPGWAWGPPVTLSAEYQIELKCVPLSTTHTKLGGLVTLSPVPPR